MSDEEFPAASLISKISKNAHTLLIRYLHRLKNACVCHDRIQFTAVRQHVEELDIILIETHRIASKQIVDHTLVR